MLVDLILSLVILFWEGFPILLFSYYLTYPFFVFMFGPFLYSVFYLLYYNNSVYSLGKKSKNIKINWVILFNDESHPFSFLVFPSFLCFVAIDLSYYNNCL